MLILKIPASYSKKHSKNQPNRPQKQLTYKDFKYLDDKSFKQELESTDWSLAIRITMTQIWVLTPFSRRFEKALSKYVPKIQGAKKNQKLEMKPWITKGIKSL